MPILQWILSLIFIIQMYLAMPVAGILFLPWSIVSRRGAYTATRSYARYVRWSLALICGLKTEVRGTVPDGDVVVASKHQSFLDIIILISALPHAKFIMKDELRYMPIFGWYAQRIGCVPVKRGKRGEAIKAMIQAVQKGRETPGQLVIFPQGTRVAPGADEPYKVGVAAIYEQTGQTCIPAACNVGLFWPRHGILRKRGTATVEFLEPIPPGLSRSAFRATSRQRIETASNALMVEEGFPADELPDID
ncbi:1-acyl-sn-glycerol-3-phosphate acyltransferase [Pseudooceanicola sp. CBS1P-1]|uniref:1-acyl-sn-glycerol-3-phosphate acyltransferase n=1 Tax=Pseudooceanicola albus TaxID=2692189 RepID=A0A6L7G686_9RHOB|nr:MULTISPECIES: lysophospholipid acyltransferase family protein [Pseudooceanicola]MBT9384823.1 1-acyl-sn-glycerol-3-phosphate acyltransferase [Pseudooceanicola endophyticus]MXN18183.1 1-acyl-sn-glycerol-3-phosphate acyltransferase [Pseudooceanicola albus]